MVSTDSHGQHPAKRPADIELNDILALGWIPHKILVKNISNPEYHLYLKKKGWFIPRWFYRSVIRCLFWTGNHSPREREFEARDSFLAYLGKKEFRGALGGWGFRVKFNPGGAPYVEIEKPLSEEECIGYTPWCMPIPYIFQKFRPRERGYDKGEGRLEGPTVTVDEAKDEIHIIYGLWFRVGERLRKKIKRATGKEPPYVCMKLHVIVELTSRHVVIRLEGTAMPSQSSFHVRPRRRSSLVHHHDMLKIKEKEIATVFDQDGGYAELVNRDDPGIRLSF